MRQGFCAAREGDTRNARRTMCTFAVFIIVFLVALCYDFQMEHNSTTAAEDTVVEARTEASSSPWPMFMGNPRHTGLSPYDTSATRGGLRWKLSMEEDIYEMAYWEEYTPQPVIGPDGTIYIGIFIGKSAASRTAIEGDVTPNFYAIYPNGTVRWSKRLYGYPPFKPPIPAVDENGTIYVSFIDGLTAINPDGTGKWGWKDGRGQWITAPTVKDGTIYIGSSGDNLGYVYAIGTDGTTLWRFRTEGGVISSPAVGDDGTVFIGDLNGTLYAVNPNGTLKWKLHIGDEMHSSPSIADDGTIYIITYWNGTLYAINPNGGIKWKFAMGSAQVHTTPAIGKDGTIYACSGFDGLYAIAPNGSVKWVFETHDWSPKSPAIGGDGTIYVTSFDGFLYAVSPNGTLKWKFKMWEHVWSSPIIGDDGTIYVASFGREGSGPKAYLYAVNTGAPSPPMNVKAYAENGTVRVEWRPPPTDGGASIVEYRIYRRLNRPANYTPDTKPIAIVDGTTFAYIDSDVENGTRYYYYIIAVNSIGESERSNVAWAMPVGIPMPPQNLTVVEGRYPILRWKYPENDGGNAIRMYNIYRCGDGINFSLIAQVDGSTQRYIDYDVECGHTYWYYITAVNEAGESEVSSVVMVVTSPTPPAPPLNLTIEVRGHNIRLKWTNPEKDGGSSVKGYKIYRSEDGINFYLISEVNEMHLDYTDVTAEPGRTHWYYVTAVNEAGESNKSNIVAIQVPPREWWNSDVGVSAILAAIVAGCACVLWGIRRRRR